MTDPGEFDGVWSLLFAAALVLCAGAAFYGHMVRYFDKQDPVCEPYIPKTMEPCLQGMYMEDGHCECKARWQE